MNSAHKITVLLADDHNVVRQGLCALLRAEGDIQVVGEAENGRQAVLLAGQLRPDIVLMDIAMPLLNGLEATRQILRTNPSARVLVLSSYSDDEYLKQLVQAGVAGYLIKQTAATELLRAIREVCKGNRFFSPMVAKRMREIAHATPPGSKWTEKTIEPTPRETEVLQLVAEGFSNKQIASELAISIKTVEKHRQQVMDKLNLHDTASLTRYAIARGLVERKKPTGL